MYSMHLNHCSLKKNQNAPRPSEHPPIVLLFHRCTVKTKLHQEYPHTKKRIPPLSKKLVLFANRNTQKNMQLLDKIHTRYDTVFTAALRQQTRFSFTIPIFFCRCSYKSRAGIELCIQQLQDPIENSSILV